MCGSPFHLTLIMDKEWSEIFQKCVIIVLWAILTWCDGNTLSLHETSILCYKWYTILFPHFSEWRSPYICTHRQVLRFVFYNQTLEVVRMQLYLFGNKLLTLCFLGTALARQQQLRVETVWVVVTVSFVLERTWLDLMFMMTEFTANALVVISRVQVHSFAHENIYFFLLFVC